MEPLTSQELINLLLFIADQTLQIVCKCSGKCAVNCQDLKTEKPNTTDKIQEFVSRQKTVIILLRWR